MTQNKTKSSALTFEDVGLYSRVYFHGEEAYVVDKGRHIVPDNEKRYLKIEYVDAPYGRADSRRIAERTVNNYLADQRSLWVDFGARLEPHQD